MGLTVSVLGDCDLAKSAPQPRELGTHLKFADITFDASYATGGLAITAAALGYTELVGVAPVASTHEEYTYAYDSANGKIAVHALAAEVAASVDLSGLTTKFVCFGI